MYHQVHLGMLTWLVAEYKPVYNHGDIGLKQYLRRGNTKLESGHSKLLLMKSVGHPLELELLEHL